MGTFLSFEFYQKILETKERPQQPGSDDSAEGIDIRVAGPVEGSDIDEAVPQFPVLEEEAVFGESILGQGL